MFLPIVYHGLKKMIELIFSLIIPPPRPKINFSFQRQVVFFFLPFFAASIDAAFVFPAVSFPADDSLAQAGQRASIRGPGAEDCRCLAFSHARR